MISKYLIRPKLYLHIMTRKTILFENRFGNLNFLHAELIKDKKEFKIYHPIENLKYNALKIQNKKIKFLDVEGEEQKDYKLVKITDYVPETIKIFGHDHYATETTIMVKNDNLKKKIELGNSKKNSKISVNGFEVQLIPSGFAPTKWDVNVLNNGESKFVEFFEDGVIVGFDETIEKVQLIEDFELN